jgi:membrane-bound lytic murein transglycosylase F
VTKGEIHDVQPERRTGRLSEYDDLFRREVGQLGWDWRLLASLAYQESQFLPTARSWAGAQGLLQLMPGTARVLGVRNRYDPEENVSGGVRFLVDLTARWTPLIADPDERLRFILASYNVGPGHVDDARRLTEKYGGDSHVWENVAYWLLQKSKREVYTDPVVRHGFARGLEPVTYVAKILERYEHYRQFVTGEEAGPEVQAARGESVNRGIRGRPDRPVQG